ncbi:crossover junction endonuclease MUS81, putative [Plasmodium malariae]|uniref:Crossover junction endonuclease MUS81 n=1 Tax=Plasmodium malariae TaxID=5858 RepID=A0A1D3SQA0_PLAMA|nr:crossover junction endonuclease MUS81, putative [Plasmodium malariae]SCO94079.1 crossover junction endonuclease MUS81, putative [Plasmodium malariae]
MEDNNYMKKLANRKIRRNYSIHPENIIFYDYFNSLKRKALAQGHNNLVISFKKIISSILKYPLPIKNSLDAYKLKGVGKRFSYYFEKALSQTKEENRYNNVNDKNGSSSGHLLRISNHINKVINNADNFIRELDDELYNIRIIGESSEDSILRNIKEIEKDYSNSNNSRCNNKKFKRKKKKKKDNIISDESSYNRSNEKNNTLHLTAKAYIYTNSKNLNNTIVSDNTIYRNKSFLECEEKSTKRSISFAKERRKNNSNNKSTLCQKSKRIELNDFEKTVLTFLDTYGHLYNEGAMSKEEITIGFLKSYRNSVNINFRTLRRLIKLEYIEKVEIFDNNSCNISTTFSISKAKKSKLKVVSKIKLTPKGKHYLEHLDHVEYLQQKKSNLQEEIVFTKEERNKTSEKENNGDKKNILSDMLSSEENFENAENVSTRIKKLEEWMKKENTYSNKENDIDLVNCDKASEKHFDISSFVTDDLNGYDIQSIDSSEEWKELNRKYGTSKYNTKREYQKNNDKSEKEYTYSSSAYTNYSISFGVTTKTEVNNCNNKERINSENEEDFIVDKNNNEGSSHNLHNLYVKKKKQDKSDNINLNFELKKKEINKKLKSSLKDRLQNRIMNMNKQKSNSSVLWSNVSKWNDFYDNYKLDGNGNGKGKKLTKLLFNHENKDEIINENRDERNDHGGHDTKKCTNDDTNTINKNGMNCISHCIIPNMDNNKVKLNGAEKSVDKEYKNNKSVLPSYNKTEQLSYYSGDWCKINYDINENIISYDKKDEKKENTKGYYLDRDTVRSQEKGILEYCKSENCNNQNCTKDNCTIENCSTKNYSIANYNTENYNTEMNSSLMKGISVLKKFGPNNKDNVTISDKQNIVDLIDLSDEASNNTIRSYASTDKYKRRPENCKMKKRNASNEEGKIKEDTRKKKRRKKKGEVKEEAEEMTEVGKEKEEMLKRKGIKGKNIHEINVKDKDLKDKDVKNKDVKGIDVGIGIEKDHISEGKGENKDCHVRYGPFEIVMVIDNRDVSGASYEQNEKMKKIFNNYKVKYITRNLPLGDIIWLCRRTIYYKKNSSKKISRKNKKKFKGEYERVTNEKKYGGILNNGSSGNDNNNNINRNKGNEEESGEEMKVKGDKEAAEQEVKDDEEIEYEEYVLKWIVERKTLNDLSASIVDGRYDEQKYRLMRSREIYHIIYLIENSNNSFKNYMNSTKVPYEMLTNAQHSTQLVNGFSILNSENMKHTFFLLCEMHIQIIQNIKEYCHIGENEYILHSDKLSLYLKNNASLWDHWNNESKKSKNNIVKEVFGKQLRLINMCGSEATELILSLWPTPFKLYEALNKYTYDGILAEKIKRIYLKNRDIIGKKRVKSPIDTQLIAQLRQMYAPDSI